LAEAALLFGWMPEQVLKMQAAVFFRVLGSARHRKFREEAAFLCELVEISAISQSFEHYKELRQHYRRRAFPEQQKKKALPVDDHRTFQIVEAAMQAAAPYVKGAPGGR
jgi:acetolactate synthase regulatory subunit